MTVREFREANALSGRDVVRVIQQTYPKFSKAALSYAENADKTGVTLTRGAREILLDMKPSGKKPRDTHKLKHRLATRVTEAQYAKFNAIREADGRFSTTQDFLKFIVMEYVREYDRHSIHDSVKSHQQEE